MAQKGTAQQRNFKYTPQNLQPAESKPKSKHNKPRRKAYKLRQNPKSTLGLYDGRKIKYAEFCEKWKAYNKSRKQSDTRGCHSTYNALIPPAEPIPKRAKPQDAKVTGHHISKVKKQVVAHSQSLVANVEKRVLGLPSNSPAGSSIQLKVQAQLDLERYNKLLKETTSNLRKLN